MQEWVTEPDALQTLHDLGEFRPGDEVLITVREKDVSKDARGDLMCERLPVKVLGTCGPKGATSWSQVTYPCFVLVDYKGPRHMARHQVVGWRRPCKSG